MFVCHSQRLVFVHAPKAAGSAAVEVLESIAGPEDVSIGDSPRGQAMGWPGGALKGLGKHATLRQLIRRLPPGVLHGYLPVMSVRNPWDRLVSFHAWARAQGFDHPQIRLAKELDFPAFLRHPAIMRAFSSAPYATYVAVPAGHPSPGPVFLRAESLADDMAALALRLGVALPAPRRVNASVRPADWRSCYTPEDAAHLARVCADDIARFGYTFQG